MMKGRTLIIVLLALGVASVAWAQQPPTQLKFSRIVDLTIPIESNMPGIPGIKTYADNPSRVDVVTAITEAQKSQLQTEGMTLNSNLAVNGRAMITVLSILVHNGTHIDAPRHFGMTGTPIDEYPLESCYVKGICLDLRHIAPKAEITPSQLEEAVRKSGSAIPKRGTVLLCTGHHARTFPTPAYSTDNPGVNVAATEWLARQGIVHFGIDSMRPGPMGVVNSLVHKACLELDITHIESLCNLEALIGQGEFRFIGLPLKWRGGTGSPIRAVAVFEE